MAFRDKYTDFTFDDKKSSSYKVWITNKNDIQLALTPNFKDKFTSPQFGGVRYLDGTTIEKTDIKISCIAIDVTLNEWRAICNWLSPTKIGKLSFDFNKHTYYDVKLSSSVTAKMFNYGGKDELLGGRKVIEFSLSFTTVGDYAAQGPINTALIGLESDLSTDSKIHAAVNELILRSANGFQMPICYTDVSTVSGEYTYVSGLRLKLDNTNFDKVAWQEEGIIHMVEYDTVQKAWIHKVYSDGTPPTIYYISQHSGTTIDVLQSNALLKTLEKSGANIIDSEEVDVDPTSINIFNTGEYETYPRIQLNNVTNNFEVWLDDVLYYKYEIINNRTLNNITIDCQSGSITYNGRFLDNATDAFGYTLVNSSYNLGPLAIPSGEPEIHLGKLLECTADGKLRFMLSEPMIYSYHDTLNLGIAISRNLYNDIKYNEGLYDSLYYEPHAIGDVNADIQLGTTSFFSVDAHNYVESDYDNTGNYRNIEITTTPNQLNAAWDGTKWKDVDWSNNYKNQIFYLSFCKGHRLTIKVSGGAPTLSHLSIQTRGAI